jgi:hypothetical protein
VVKRFVFLLVHLLRDVTWRDVTRRGLLANFSRGRYEWQRAGCCVCSRLQALGWADC